jgi:hypothetical protein
MTAVEKNTVGTGVEQVRNGQVAWRHIRAEFADEVEGILKTLAPTGPYAYTYGAMPGPDETPQQRIATTYEHISELYHDLHRVVTVVDMRPVVELRTDWYTFMYGSGSGKLKETDELSPGSLTAVLFPTMGYDGITGELFRSKSFDVPIEATEANGGLDAPLSSLQLVDAMIEAYRKGDTDGVLALCDPNVQTAVPDYVEDTGTLTEFHTADEARTHLEQFFAKYTVRELEVINRYAADWFVFSELYWLIAATSGPDVGATFRYRTAEITEVSATRMITARLGHGTPRIAAEEDH